MDAERVPASRNMSAWGRRRARHSDDYLDDGAPVAGHLWAPGGTLPRCLAFDPTGSAPGLPTHAERTCWLMLYALAVGVPPFFTEVTALLVCSAVIAYFGYRLKLVPIVGFLLTGVMIGPGALGLVANQELVDATAQVGVILLLFTIGIEFSLEKLARIKRLIFGGGGLQVVLASLVTLGLLLPFGVPWQAGLFTGFLVALSSTAIVLKLLGQRGEAGTEAGQGSLGILIFQDLAIVVMVLLVPMLAGQGGSAMDVLIALGKAGLIIVVALVGARRVMPLVLERVAKTCSQELFLLSLIAICFGMAGVASLAGVSLELGAFLAGLVVSESRFSEHAFGEIMPLQILFSATFFVSVGMLLDLGFLVSNLPLVLSVVVVVLVVKVVTAAVSMKALGLATSSSVAVAFMLAQVGEFSFVLERAGRELDLYPAGMAGTGSQTFIAATVVLMVLTPPLSQLGGRFAQRLERRAEPEPDESGRPVESEESSTPPSEHAGMENHVVVAGFGRAARRFAQVLLASRTPHVIITLSPERAAEAETDGRVVVRGDATRQNALRHAGLTRAKMLFVPDEDAEFAHRVTRVARTLNPTLRIVTRARLESAAEAMAEAGTDHVVTEEMETVVQLFGAVLRDYQVDPAEVENCLGVVRNERYLALRDSAGAAVLAPIGDMIAGAQDTRTVTLRSGAPIVGEALGDVGFEEMGLSVQSLRRGHSVVTMPPAHLALEEHDMVTLGGTADAFGRAADLFRTEALESVPPTTAGFSGGDAPVQVYGADWCPLTGGFRGYLKQVGVPYDYHDIENDSRAEEAVRAMNGGEVKFPMVVVGEHVMKNPPIEELNGALRASSLLSADAGG